MSNISLVRFATSLSRSVSYNPSRKASNSKDKGKKLLDLNDIKKKASKLLDQTTKLLDQTTKNLKKKKDEVVSHNPSGKASDSKDKGKNLLDLNDLKKTATELLNQTTKLLDQTTKKLKKKKDEAVSHNQSIKASDSKDKEKNLLDLHNLKKTATELLDQTTKKLKKKKDEATVSTTTTTTPTVTRAVDHKTISFDDHVVAFKSKTNWEIIRSILVYEMCSYDFIVNNRQKIMNGLRKTVGTTAFIWIMKMTFYGHFVAGEDEYKMQPLVQRLLSFGVWPMLDYAIEDDLPSDKAKQLEKKATIPQKDTIKHDKQFQYSEKFADRRYKVHHVKTFFYFNEATCERNMEFFLRCIEALTQTTGTRGITAIKLTALGRPQLLLQLSEVIVRTRRYINDLVGGEGSVISHHIKKDELIQKISTAKVEDKRMLEVFLNEIDADSEGIINIFPWSGILTENHELNATFRIPDLKTGKMVPLITKLSDTEEAMFRNMVRRFNTIVTAAKVMGSTVEVDAEQTYFQPAISRFTVEFMRKYNTEKVLVMNTYQTYLRNTLSEVRSDLEHARRKKFCFGAKLVRGAYLEQERERAATLNYPDPMNPDFETTTKMLHDTIELMIAEHVKYRKEGKKDRIYLNVASHNEDTMRFTMKRMKENDIQPSDGVVSVAQLLGMCDYITFPMGQAGYTTFKYIPYGPVLHAIPYLSRRAQENRAMLSKLNKEKRMLKKELIRRLITGKFIYTPTP